MCRHTFLQSLISVNYCKVTIPAPYLQEQRHIYSILADRRAQKSPAPTPYHNAKTSKAMPQHAPLRFCITNKLSGKDGIRTRDTLLTYTRFPGVPLQPLEHLSLIRVQRYNNIFVSNGAVRDFSGVTQPSDAVTPSFFAAKAVAFRANNYLCKLKTQPLKNQPPSKGENY